MLTICFRSEAPPSATNVGTVSSYPGNDPLIDAPPPLPPAGPPGGKAMSLQSDGNSVEEEDFGDDLDSPRTARSVVIATVIISRSVVLVTVIISRSVVVVTVIL